MDSDRHSTCPTSTTSKMRTPVRQDDSPTSDHSSLRTPNNLSDVSRASLRLTATASHAFFRSTAMSSYPSGSTFAQGSSRFVTNRPSSSDGRQKQINSIVAEEIAPSKAACTQKSLHAGNRCFHKSAVQSYSIQTNSERGEQFN